jgi:hypothetical protein
MIIGGICSSIIGSICICCSLIAVVALKYYSKSLKNNSTIPEKEEKELETIPEKKADEQKPESTISKNDTQIVVDNEGSKRVEQQKKDEILEKNLDPNEQKASIQKKEDEELEV